VKRLAIATTLIASLLTGTAARAITTSEANAALVMTVAIYKDKCSAPLPEVVNAAQLKLIKNHDFNNDQAMDAMIDVSFTLNKLGIKVWCQTMAKGFSDNADLLTAKLKAAAK
jgi:hypothetical protein